MPMKGLIPKTLAGLCGAGLLAAAGGCGTTYRDLVDPCYPERYQYMAREAVNAAMAPQMQNGHTLDQTVWNHHFEPGTDKLTASGQEHLKYLARRRPHPDPVVFLQTAQDVAYDPAAPEKSTKERFDLNERRGQAVQRFLGAYTAGTGHDFRVVVHDPAEVGIAARPIAGDRASGVQGSVPLLYRGFQGVLPGIGTTTTISGQGGGGTGTGGS
jgi:hypothetical protein